MPNFVARKAAKSSALNTYPKPFEDAKVNAALNHIENVEFLAGDMKDILNSEFIDRNGRPDVIITDPPRAGMHADVINTILYAYPQKID